MRRVLMFLLIVLFLPAAARAASFDCRKARTADERAVCATPLLSELDEIMALLHGRLRRYTQRFDNAMGLQGRLVGEARSFLKRRAACGGDAACIERAYRKRILELLERWRRAMDAGEGAADAAPQHSGGVSCKSLKLQSTRRFRERCSKLEDPGMIARWELGGGLAACVLPCTPGPYNVGLVAWLMDGRTGRVLRPLRFPVLGRDGRLEQADEIVSASFDPGSGTASAFNRGRGLGDCGERYRWRWNGKAFELTEQRLKDTCDGKFKTGWRKVWPR